MKIGIIGAGKVGTSLGKYFCEHNIPVVGYYSKSIASAQAAADFTKTDAVSSMEDLVNASDTLFLTTGDSAISEVWKVLKNLPIENKIICHCSGSLSSSIFSEERPNTITRCSAHPLLSFPDRETGSKLLANAVITLEGDGSRFSEMEALWKGLGNRVQTIDQTQKALYHCAAVTVSNHVLALLDWGVALLARCGFDREQALSALSPLIRGNVDAALAQGILAALTGPVERCDTETVLEHLHSLENAPKEQQLYGLLAQRLVDLAAEKHPKRDYSELRTILGGLF